MKQSKLTKITALMLSMVMVTSVFVGNTLSRYVTSVSSTDNARVAVWGINGNEVTMELFKTAYDLDGKKIAEANLNDDGVTRDKIIAPGTGGSSAFSIINFESDAIPPEVLYELKISLDDSQVDDFIKNNPYIQWKLDNNSWGTWDNLKTSILSLSGNESGIHVYEPGKFATAFKDNVEHTISWQWALDGNNEVDTQMGNNALIGDISAEISVKITAKQVDLDTTGLLDGDNQIFNLDNPSVLTFRSAIPLDELKEVKVDNRSLTLNEDYVATEGSSIITLNEDYLKTLSVGTYIISIISENMTSNARFKVIAEEVVEVASSSYLNINDVSKIPHNLSIKLTSDTITDFSNVTVDRYGSNAINLHSAVNDNLVFNNDGSFTLSAKGGEKIANCSSKGFGTKLAAGTPIFFSADIIESVGENIELGIRLSNSDGTFTFINAASIDSPSNSYILEKDIIAIRLLLKNKLDYIPEQSGNYKYYAQSDNFITFKNFKFNIGQEYEYEDYISFQRVTAQSDGTVEGLTSVSPNMTITVDTQGVNINCNYQKQGIAYNLKGKTIVNFGDSIFGNYKAPNDISSFISNKTNATVYNVGFGSAQMSENSTAKYEPFGMKNLANAITTGDWTSQDEIINSGSAPTAFKRCLPTLKSINFNDVDIITIAYGTNDFKNGKTLKEVEDATKYSIETILNKYPHIDIVLCTPIYRYWLDESGNFIEDSNTKEINGVKLTEYIQLYKKIANEYGLLLIDNYNYSGIKSNNRTDCFNEPDTTHPNEIGRQMIAENMAKELYNYFK